jgi:hypothetical protein
MFLHGGCELVHSQWLWPRLACLGRLENRDALGEKYGGPRGEQPQGLFVAVIEVS